MGRLKPQIRIKTEPSTPLPLPLTSRITRPRITGPRVSHLKRAARLHSRRLPALGRRNVNNSQRIHDRSFDAARYGTAAVEDMESGLRRLASNTQSVIIAVAGSCFGNGRRGARAGYGACFSFASNKHDMNGLIALSNPQTSQYAIIQAVTKAIEKVHELLQNVARRQDFTHVVVETSSQYVVKALCRDVWRWTANGYVTVDGQSVINARAFKYLHEQALLLENEYGMRVSFSYLRAECNEVARGLAREAIRSQ